MLSLHDLLKRHACMSFARVIENADLAPLEAAGVKPLVLAGVACMNAVEAWRHRRNHRLRRADSVSLVFDGGEEGKGALRDATSEGVARPLFEDSCEATPLQAADWLAWELSRLNRLHIKHRGHGGEIPIAVRGEVWAAVHHLPQDWKYYHKGEWVNIIRST